MSKGSQPIHLLGPKPKEYNETLWDVIMSLIKPHVSGLRPLCQNLGLGPSSNHITVVHDRLRTFITLTSTTDYTNPQVNASSCHTHEQLFYFTPAINANMG